MYYIYSVCVFFDCWTLQASFAVLLTRLWKAATSTQRNLLQPLQSQNFMLLFVLIQQFLNMFHISSLALHSFKISLSPYWGLSLDCDAIVERELRVDATRSQGNKGLASGCCSTVETTWNHHTPQNTEKPPLIKPRKHAIVHIRPVWCFRTWIA